MRHLIKAEPYSPVFLCIFFSLLLIGAATSFAQKYTLADSSKAMNLVIAAYGKTQGSLEKNLEQANEAVAISKEIGYLKGIEKGIKTVGYVYYRMGDMKNAYLYLTDALNISKRYNHKEDEAKVLFHFGLLYIYIGEFNKAFECHLQALKIEESLHDTGAIADAYKSMAVDLAHQKLFDEGNKYLLKAIALYHQLKDTESESKCFSYIGTNYSDLGEYKEAYQYFLRSLQTKKISETYGNLGYYFFKLKKDDSALYYYRLARSMSEADGSKLDVARMEENIGTCLIRRGDLPKAEEHLKLALSMMREVSYIEAEGQVDGNLSELYALKQDYKNAYLYRMDANRIKDSILNARTQAKIAELNTRFEVKELEQKNTSLQGENELQKLKLQRKNFLIYGALSAFASLLIIGILFIRQSKLRAAQQKTELEQKQLRAQMNPHFIFNCLNSIQHFVVVNDVKNANKYLSGFASLMRQTLENSKEDTITLRKEIAYLENYLALECMRFENTFTTQMICAANLNTDTIEIPSMIIQPFIENAIRHGLCYLENKPGILKISFYKSDNYLFCEVDDNGIGRERSQKVKMASEVVYESQGMELTRQRLALVSKSNGSDYKIEIIDKKSAEDEPEGTTVIIKFSLNT